MYAVLYPPDKTWEGKVRQRQRGGGPKAALADRWNRQAALSPSSTRRPIPPPNHARLAIRSEPTTDPPWIHHLLPVFNVVPSRARHGRRSVTRAALSPASPGAGGGGGPYGRHGRPPSAVANVQLTPRATKGALQRQEQNAYGQEHLLLVNEHTNKVVSLGPTVAGKTHDKKAADAAQIGYPTNATLGKDTGFQRLYEQAESC